MTGFIVAAAAAVAIVLVLMMRPFFRRMETTQTSRSQLNAAIYREQIAKLDQDLAEGTLGRDDYAQAKTELQRRLLEDSQAADETATVRTPRKTMIGVAIAVPIVAGAMYLMLGNPAAMSGGPGGLPPGHEQMATQADLDKMIAGLAAKLEAEPTNYKGWTMLARAYKAVGRPVEAQRAFEKAGSFIDDDAQALASYADVVATNNGGSLAGKPTELIRKALKVDPANPMALWLAGTADFEAKNYKQAADTWEKLVAMLPPGSDDSRMLEGAINDARTKGGLPPRASTAVAAASGGVVKGVVELDPAIKDKASPQDIVMVIARKPGMRMPLAVLRQSASSMPMPFTLDDSLSMDPNSKLSSSPEVEIEARISKTGLAMPNAGDLLSAPQTVKLGANNVTLRVAKVIQ
jgi:cytochrome c-type biogenesis protein CcmH